MIWDILRQAIVFGGFALSLILATICAVWPLHWDFVNPFIKIFCTVAALSLILSFVVALERFEWFLAIVRWGFE